MTETNLPVVGEGQVRAVRAGRGRLGQYPAITVGDLRAALEPFTDDARLLMPVTLFFHLDLTNGSRVEIDVDEGDL